MATPQRNSRPGTYFVTSATRNRRRLFQNHRTAELLLETLQHYPREGHYKTWQKAFTDQRVRDLADFVHHREYIHHNPVRARLCELPEDYA